MHRILIVSVLFSFLVISGCYSLKGISIDPNTDTFYVPTFQSRSDKAPADIGPLFSEMLKDRINGQTRLQFDEDTPDIELNGFISNYNVRQQAPQRGQTTAFNRLSITVKIEYINNQNDEDQWDQSFSFFEDFDNTTDVTAVQDELTERIFDQIIQDIFNRAFANW